MSISDSINGFFELVGALLMLLNVRRILKDRQVRGVDWRITSFFAVWGFWNLFYYPSLRQWISFSGGLVMTIANTVWLWLAIKYRKN